MTKEELLNLDEEDLHDFVEKFCHERYFKLGIRTPYFKCGYMEQPQIEKDAMYIPYYVEYRGCGEYDYFKIPLDYFTMTDEEILRDVTTKQRNNEINKKKNEIFKVVERYESVCSEIKDFLVNRYSKLQTKHYVPENHINDLYFDFNGGVIDVSYWEEHRGCSEDFRFELPIDYLFMTDEEILNDLKELMK